MANTYTQHFFHVVFAVRNRESLIIDDFKEDLYRYISGIISNKKQSLFIINGIPDHIHLLINCKPDVNLSNLVQEIKEHSSKFINEKRILKGKFYWQPGFGSFTVSKKDVAMIINYIKSQQEHHKRFNFKEEYLGLLKENEIDFKEEYLFDFNLQ